MNGVQNFFRMKYLQFKNKIIKLLNNKWIQGLLSMDVAWVFLFLAIKLFGYNWTWYNLLACIGLWVVVKELFKQMKIIALIKK